MGWVTIQGMCGRYTLVKTGQLPELFEISETRIPPRYNIAPTQNVAVIRRNDEGIRQLDFLHWGLVPFWAREKSIGSRLINARSESVAEKPAFRQAFRKRRCLIPSDGFYEWAKRNGRKQPYYFYLREELPFAFAGLWEEWKENESTLQSCTILTCPANEVVAACHNRMPVILERGEYDAWLAPESSPKELQSLLDPFPSEKLKRHPVSTVVNNPAHELTDCIVPLAEEN